MKQNLTLSVLALILLSFISNGCQEPKDDISNERFSVSMNIASNPQTANPLYYNSSNDIYICRHLFQPLLSINDSFNDYIPILAEKLPTKVEMEGKTAFQYALKSEARWDNGSALSSDDVISTFKMIFNPHSDLPYLIEAFDFIDSIVAINDLEFFVFINTSSNNVLFNTGDIEILPKYIFDENAILDKYSFKQLKTYNPGNSVDSTLLMHGEGLLDVKILKSKSGISGTGAYRILEYNINQNVKLVKKENWWGSEFSSNSYLFKAYPDEINLKIYMDPMAASMDFTNQKLDVLFGLNQDLLNSITEDEQLMQNTITKEFSLNALVYLCLNNEDPYLQKIEVRNAMALLADPKTFIEKILDNQAIPISSPVLRKNKRLYNSNLEPLNFDTEKAISLLKKAGWQRKNSVWYFNNEEVIFEFLIQTGNKNSEDYGIFFKNNASKIGLEINLIPLEFTEFITRIRVGNYSIARLGTGIGPMFENYRSLFHSSSIDKNNYPRINKSEIDSLIEKIEIETDANSKRTMILELQELIYNEFNYVFLYSPKTKVFVNSRLEGFTLNPDALQPWLAAFKRKE